MFFLRSVNIYNRYYLRYKAERDFWGNSGCRGSNHNVNIQIFSETNKFWAFFLSLEGIFFREKGRKWGSRERGNAKYRIFAAYEGV